MTEFAKIYTHPGVGQILVLRTPSDDGPEVQVHFYSPGKRRCVLKMCFPDDDDGETSSEEIFEALHYDKVVELVSESVHEMGEPKNPAYH